MVMIGPCHGPDPGSIPGRGAFVFFCDIMLSSKQKLILNIISISLIAIISIILLVIGLQKDYKYKLDYGKIVFYSDTNIFDNLKQLQDTNLILIVFDDSQNAHIASLIQYIQTFTIYKKQTNFYIMSKEECIFSDPKNRSYSTIKKEECISFLDNLKYTKIILGNINTKLDKTNIYIENNNYKIISNSKDSFTEYEKFLEILYPNYLEDLSGLENFTTEITKNIN